MWSKTHESVNAEKIKFYKNMKCEEFFHYALVINEEEDATCIERREYKALQNGEFIQPKNNSDKYKVEKYLYEFEVGPGETKATFIKLGLKYSFGDSEQSSEIILGDQALKNLCMSKKKTKYGNEKISFYKAYNGWDYLMYFRNDTKDKKFQQKWLVNVENLELSDENELEGDEKNLIIVRLGPGEDKLYKFLNTNGEKPVTSFKKYGPKITDVNQLIESSEGEGDQ